jgi:hypothetical protein
MLRLRRIIRNTDLRKSVKPRVGLTYWKSVGTTGGSTCRVEDVGTVEWQNHKTSSGVLPYFEIKMSKPQGFRPIKTALKGRCRNPRQGRGNFDLREEDKSHHVVGVDVDGQL